MLPLTDAHADAVVIIINALENYLLRSVVGLL